MKKNTSIIFVGILSLLLISFQLLKDIRVKNQVFDVNYSQSLQQPLELTYRSTNRPTNVNRGSMDFHTEKGVVTSDHQDYSKNVLDKGHIAPAATF